MLRILIVLALVIGCASPEYNDIETADVYKVYHQDKALVWLEGEFRDEFNVNIRAFDKVTIRWTDTPCPYNDNWAVIVDNHCHSGIMWDCEHIYVAMDKQDKATSTCNTALTQELGHCLRSLAGWNKDSEHNDTYFWEFIENSRKKICDRGW